MNIDASAIGQFLVSAAFAGIVVAVINSLISPKARAEAKQAASATAREEVKMSMDALRTDVNAARDRAAAADEKADSAQAEADAAQNQVRLLRDVLWACASYLRRLDTVLTQEQREAAGPRPDVDKYLQA